jgi:hypothetical protein
VYDRSSQLAWHCSWEKLLSDLMVYSWSGLSYSVWVFTWKIKKRNKARSNKPFEQTFTMFALLTASALSRGSLSKHPPHRTAEARDDLFAI